MDNHTFQCKMAIECNLEKKMKIVHKMGILESMLLAPKSKTIIFGKTEYFEKFISELINAVLVKEFSRKQTNYHASLKWTHM